MQTDLTSADSHFAFGRNWAEYAQKLSEAEIEEAVGGLSRLLGGESLEGKRFLDVGSGSGLHSLAALRLNAREVVAMDLDVESVATTRAVLTRFAPAANWRAHAASVFELDRSGWGEFDVVYSWGVLHHTGDMARAIRNAAAMVANGGRLVFALYRRVWMDWFWRWEKRWYAHASPTAQARARGLYVGLFKLGLLATGRRFSSYVANYRGNRGMDYYHDVHDWMGGWPYESVSPGEVDGMMRQLGFAVERIFARRGWLLGRDPGVFSSGCDEFVYRRVTRD